MGAFFQPAAPGEPTAEAGESSADDAGRVQLGRIPPSQQARPAVKRPPGRRRRISTRRYVAEWVVILAAALSVALFVRATVVQAFFIPSESMVPTLEIGDRVLVDKVSYRLHEVHRGDVVVFHRPPGSTNLDIKDLIKRVIGLPGETIEARRGVVYINGERIKESYLVEGVETEGLPRQVIPVNRYFVMGDNRGNSSDSRVFGTIDRSLIVGRAVVRVYPLRRVGGI